MSQRHKLIHILWKRSSEIEITCFFVFSLLSHKTMTHMWQSKREKVIVVECRGHDAARLQNVDHLHG
jgi:hypothetical protein